MVPDLNHPILLYACVAHGATVLAELVPGAGARDVAAVARRCLAAAPPFHREYSHTAGGRIYAFAMADPLVLFAIADASLGAPRAFLFLRRLRRSAAAAAAAAAAPLQSELLPELRRLALALPDEVDDSPPAPPSPLPPPPPPPPTTNEPPKPGSSEEKKTKKKKQQQEQQQRPLGGVAGAMEISVAATDAAAAAADPLPESMRVAWRRHLRAILLADLALCGLLFAIWISVCKGFLCIRR